MDVPMAVPIAVLGGAVIFASDQGIAAGRCKRQPVC
jgi:hypothetical protein